MHFYISYVWYSYFTEQFSIRTWCLSGVHTRMKKKKKKKKKQAISKYMYLLQPTSLPFAQITWKNAIRGKMPKNAPPKRWKENGSVPDSKIIVFCRKADCVLCAVCVGLCTPLPLRFTIIQRIIMSCHPTLRPNIPATKRNICCIYGFGSGRFWSARLWDGICFGVWRYLLFRPLWVL